MSSYGRPDGWGDIHNTGTEPSPSRTRLGSEEASCHFEHFIANEVKTDARGFLRVEKTPGYSFLNMLAKFVPRVALCKYVVGETFCDKATIGVLGNAEYQFHRRRMSRK